MMLTSAPDGNAVTDFLLESLAKLTSKVVADVARLQVVSLRVP